jgi:hypothetical protein
MAPLKTNLDDSFQIIIQTTHVIYLASLKYTIAFLTTKRSSVHFILES